MKILDNGQRTKKYRKELIRLCKIHFQDEFLKHVLDPIYKSQNSGGLVLSINPFDPHRRQGSPLDGTICDLSKVVYFIPDIAFYVCDNPGALSHLHLSVGPKSLYKCRRCLVPRHLTDTPGAVGAPRIYDQNLLRALTLARIALIRKWRNERLTELDEELTNAMKYCTSKCYIKCPIEYIKDAVFDDFNIMESCPIDEFHTMSLGLLKNWVVWTAVIIATCVKRDTTNQYNDGLEEVDDILMTFPTHFIPENLKRHRFVKVGHLSNEC